MNPYRSIAVRQEFLLKALTQLLLASGAVSVFLALGMFLAAPPMSTASLTQLLHWGLWSMASGVGLLLIQGNLFRQRFSPIPSAILMVVCLTLLFVCLKLAYPFIYPFFRLVMQSDSVL